MENPYRILLEALEHHGFDRETAIGIMLPLDEKEDLLDLAKWIADHPEAQRRDALKEMHKLLRKRSI